MSHEEKTADLIEGFKKQSESIAAQWQEVFNEEQEEVSAKTFMSERDVIKTMREIVIKRDAFGKKYSELISEIDKAAESYADKENSEDLSKWNSLFESVQKDIDSLSLDFSMSGTINEEIGQTAFVLPHSAIKVIEKWSQKGGKKMEKKKTVYIAEEQPKEKKPKKKMGKRGKLALLVLALIVVAIIVFMYWYKSIRPKKDISNSTVTYKTEEGDQVSGLFVDIIEDARESKGFNINKIFFDTDSKKIKIESDTSFEQLSDADKLDFFIQINERAKKGEYTFDDSSIGKRDAEDIAVYVDKDHYRFNEDYSREKKYQLSKNWEDIYEKTVSTTYYSDEPSGGSSGGKLSTCPNCNGTGATKTYATDNPWEEATYIECPMCHGTGKV